MHDKKPRREVIERIRQGATIMVYPHSALPPWWYDGILKVPDYLACLFVIGEGQKSVMNIIAPEVNVQATGWAWCKQKTFIQPQAVKHILFCPIHPAGGLRPEALKANRAIFKELKRLRVNVTIRYIGDMERQGLKPYGGFTFIEGRPDGSHNEIDAADVVIAEGTAMYMSIARGKPTVGINQHLPLRANKDCVRYTPHNWHKYGDLLAYPINYEEGKLAQKIQWAVKEEQTEWRRLFIGDQLAPVDFGRKVESAWRQHAHC